MRSPYAPIRRRRLPVLVAVVVGLSACAGGGSETLVGVSSAKLSFGSMGKSCGYHLKSSISSNDRGIQRDMQIESHYTATVDSVGEEGHLYIRYDLNEFSVARFVQGNVAYDEGSEAFRGQSVRLTMSPAGDIVRRQGLEVTDLTTPEGRSLKDILMRTFALRSQRYPQEAVRMGDSWTRTLLASDEDRTSLRIAGGHLQGQLTRTYQVQAFVAYKGHSCAQILVTTAGKYTGEGLGQRDRVTMDIDVEGAGTVYFDYESHCIVSEKEHTKATQRGTRPPDRLGEEGKVELLIIESDVEIHLEPAA